jgi:hypothetical protein
MQRVNHESVSFRGYCYHDIGLVRVAGSSDQRKIFFQPDFFYRRGENYTFVNWLTLTSCPFLPINFGEKIPVINSVVITG